MSSIVFFVVGQPCTARDCADALSFGDRRRVGSCTYIANSGAGTRACRAICLRRVSWPLDHDHDNSPCNPHGTFFIPRASIWGSQITLGLDERAPGVVSETVPDLSSRPRSSLGLALAPVRLKPQQLTLSPFVSRDPKLRVVAHGRKCLYSPFVIICDLLCPQAIRVPVL